MNKKLEAWLSLSKICWVVGFFVMILTALGSAIIEGPPGQAQVRSPGLYLISTILMWIGPGIIILGMIIPKAVFLFAWYRGQQARRENIPWR
jgi:hypothetical protein